ncbi:MAG: ATP-binding protein [Pseudomonadota bacterium]
MYSLIPVVVAFYFLLLGAAVLAQAKSHRAARPFLAMCATTFVWQMSWAVLFQQTDPAVIKPLITLGYLFIIFLPTTLYHFLVAMAELRTERKYVYFSYALAMVLAVIAITTDWFVDGYYLYYWGPYPKAGIMHPLHVAQTVIVVVRGLVLAQRKQFTANEPLKTQLEYCVASVFIYLVAGVDYLCNYGVEFYPPGIYFVSLSLSIFAYALIKSNLLDAQAALARIASTLVVAFAVIFSFVLLQHLLAVDQVSLVIADALLGVLWAFGGTKIQKRLQQSAERRWLTSGYSPEFFLDRTLKRLLPLLHSKDIALAVADLVVDTLTIKHAALLLRTAHGFQVLADDRQRYTQEFCPLHITELWSNAPAETLTQEKISVDSPLRALSAYSAHGYLVPMFSSQRLEAVLVLGERVGARGYGAKDKRALDTVSRQVHVFLDRAAAHGAAVEHALAEHSERLLLTQAIAANIAHELRTPLSTVALAAKSLEKYMPVLWQGYEIAALQPQPMSALIPPPRKEVIKNGLDTIIRSVHRAQVVITLLLANVRGEINAGEGFTTHSARLCVERALEDYPFQGKLRDTIKFEGDFDFIFHGSDTLMIYVIYNLMKNAMYSLAKAGKGEVKIWFAVDAKYNEIHFRDTGSGIAPAVLPRIFDDFYTTKPGDVGAGLGLTFCKRVVTSFGGHIECHSVDGDYTEFIIYLPGLNATSPVIDSKGLI